MDVKYNYFFIGQSQMIRRMVISACDEEMDFDMA